MKLFRRNIIFLRHLFGKRTKNALTFIKRYVTIYLLNRGADEHESFVASRLWGADVISDKQKGISAEA